MSGPGLLVLAAWLAGGEASADSHCISSRVYCYPQPEVVTSAPSHSACAFDAFYGTSCASYDIPAGTLSGSGGGSGSATMSDSFQVVGPTEGTPLEFAAQLILSGHADGRCNRGSGGGSAQLIEGSSNAANASFRSQCGWTPIQTTLEVQVHRLSGERFRVSAYVAAGGIEGSSAAIYGTLRFSGLPDGASVVSCNGFLQAPPVPVARGSWGELKTRYR